MSLEFGREIIGRLDVAESREWLVTSGVGSPGEIFDGDPPHAPRGAVAQAWSVSETLRAWTLLAP